VQHLLLQHQSEVRAWVEAGAAIYVCGSNRGMAPSVNEGLATILGEDQLQFIAHARRYLRDIY
jgi:sulfite reductase (NADPH) flavoprotein alpha-component